MLAWPVAAKVSCFAWSGLRNHRFQHVVFRSKARRIYEETMSLPNRVVPRVRSREMLILAQTRRINARLQRLLSAQVPPKDTTYP
jgi:hypothetical protein